MSRIEQRLEELGIKLPEPSELKFPFVPCNQTGNLVYVSGQICTVDGKLLYKGKLGKEVTIEQGQAAARQTIINSLAALKGYLGNLDRIVKVVKVLGFVNSEPNFAEQSYVINGASDLLVDIFGENGKHARSAIGCSALPLHTPVEVEIIVEVSEESV